RDAVFWPQRAQRALLRRRDPAGAGHEGADRAWVFGRSHVFGRILPRGRRVPRTPVRVTGAHRRDHGISARGAGAARGTRESDNNVRGTVHDVVTVLVSRQNSISRLQTHNVNRCGRSRHLASKRRLRRKRSSPNVFEMAATETITSIILIKLIRVSLGTVRHP